MLPIAPFTETAGTFVNTEGRVQSFTAWSSPLARRVPAGKCCACWATCSASKASISPRRTKSVPRLLGGAPEFVSEQPAGSSTVRWRRAPAESRVLERVADIPLYFADPWFAARRRCKRPRMRRATRAHERGHHGGGRRGRRPGGASAFRPGVVVSLTARLDEALANGCVRVAGAHESTAALRPLSGMISVEGL